MENRLDSTLRLVFYAGLAMIAFTLGTAAHYEISNPTSTPAPHAKGKAPRGKMTSGE